MISSFLLSFAVSVVVSFYGERAGWSYMIRFLTSLGITFAMLAVLASISKADDTVAFSRLKDYTVHIAIGTGFAFQGDSGKSYLMTNWHVCNLGSWKRTLTGNYEGGRIIQGQIARMSPAYDLCAISVPKDHKGLKVALTLAPNQQIYTRGYPYSVLSETKGHFIGVKSWVFTYSIEDVGACFPGSTDVLNLQDHIAGCKVRYIANMTDMYARPGSSGSPVINSVGDLVGVMSSWDSSNNLGGMVRLEDLQDFVKGL